MPRTPQELCKYHVKNLRAIDDAKDQVSGLLRQAIKTDDKRTRDVLVRLLALLLAAWAECRLRKLLYEHEHFSAQDRTKITGAGSQLQQWEMAVEVAFRKHYNRPHGPLDSPNFPRSAFTQYTDINRMLDTDLRAVILLRNRLSHGQWIYTLNEAGTEVDTRLMRVLRTETILSLQAKTNLLLHLANIIQELVVSPPTFQRNFDHYYRSIEENRLRLSNTRDEYQRYVTMMKDRHQRGQQRARATS